MRKFILASSVLIFAATVVPAAASTPRYLGPPIKQTDLTITSLAKTLNGNIGSYFIAHFQVSGGTAPYAWKSDMLPPGLSLTLLASAIGNCANPLDDQTRARTDCTPLYSSGTDIVVSGTPTANGSLSSTFSVTDSNGKSVSKTFIFTIGGSSASEIQIQSKSDLSGVINRAFSAEFQASGGSSPYAWGVASGSLPTGTKLVFSAFNCLVAPCVNPKDSAYISGTPTQEGIYTFTLQVTDSRGKSAISTFSITIKGTAVENSGIKITSPQAGEIWLLGSTHTISWSNYTLGPRAVALVITLHPPRPACLDSNPRCLIAEHQPFVISASTPDTGSFSWTIPKDLPSAFQGTQHVTIAAVENSSVSGRSAAFTVGSSGGVVPPKPGTLVIGDGGTVYFITSDGKKYGFTSYNDFVRRGFRFDQVQRIDKTSLDVVPETTTFERGGNVSVRYRNKPAIYYLTTARCKQVYPSMETLRAWQVAVNDVVVVNDSEQYPDCSSNIVSFPEHTLVRILNTPTIYVLRTGRRLPFASFEAFKAQGFVGKPIVVLSDAELSLYTSGDVIK